MAPAFVQVFKNTGGSGFVQAITTAASGSATTSGNALYVFCQAQSGANDITSVTDNKGNTFVRLDGVNNSTTIDLEVWYCQNITGGSGHTVTSNDSGFVNGNVFAVEISGLPTTGNIYDANGKLTGAHSGSMTTTASSATTNASDILIYFSCISTATLGTWTAGNLGGSAATNLTVSASTTSGAYTCALEFQVVAATGTFSGAITQSTTNQSDASLLIALANTAIVNNAPNPAQYKRRDQQPDAHYRKPLIVMS